MSPSPSVTSVQIRRERAGDVDAVADVVAAAFSMAEHSAPPTRPGGPPGEVDLVAWLRADPGWLPDLSVVAVTDKEVLGHVVCTRAYVDGAPALGLGPLSVRPDRQSRGIGQALVRHVLERADEAGETLVALLGDPAYYRRLGFVPARDLGVEPPEPAWGDHFQAQALGGRHHPVGRFAYAEPFNRF